MEMEMKMGEKEKKKCEKMYKIHVLDIEQVSLWRSLYNYLDKVC